MIVARYKNPNRSVLPNWIFIVISTMYILRLEMSKRLN